MNPTLLDKCQSIKCVKCLHAYLLITGSVTSSDIILNKIIRAYCRFAAVDYARNLFNDISQPNSFLWTSLIHGHVENRRYDDALDLFKSMRAEAVHVLNFTFSSILKSMARKSSLRVGETIHGLIWKCGFDKDLIVQNSILDLYSRCGQVDVAYHMFDEMSDRDIVSWNSIISGYVNDGKLDEARTLFDNMPEKNVISWTAMISGYAMSGDMDSAYDLFLKIPTRDSACCNVMISGFMNSGNINMAHRIFFELRKRDIGSWNMMIQGFCKLGDMHSAREYFKNMPQKNSRTWIMMIDGYIKIGDIENARLLFDQLEEKNLVSWSCIIDGYAKMGQPIHGWKLFEKFKETNLEPDETFILAIVSICTQLGILDAAETTLNKYMKPSHLSNLQLVTSLIDMYSKCGCFDKAFEIFKRIQRKDTICYSSMIMAFANHGMGHGAISLFDQMLKEGIKPDGITFIALLTACSHSGLVDEGNNYLRLMVESCGIYPTDKHYACMVDLLGRAGRINEAYKLITSMSVEPNPSIWGSLLSACRVHGNIELAELAANHLFEIEPNNSGSYVLMSNMYSVAGRWEDVAKMRSKIRELRVKKNIGSSWIEFNGVIHEFIMGDVSHFDTNRIYSLLKVLLVEMKSVDVPICEYTL